MHPETSVREFRSRGIAIPMVLVLACGLLVVVLYLFQFARESYRRSTRGIHATAAEVLAESAVEEVWYRIQRDCNDPKSTSGIYKAFRTDDMSAGKRIDLTVSTPVLFQRMKDGKWNGWFESRFDPDDAIAVEAFVAFKNPYDGLSAPGVPQGVLDSYAESNGSIGSIVPKERVGVVTIAAEVTPTLWGEIGSFRRFEVQHVFRVALMTPPIPFDMSGLVIMYPEYVSEAGPQASLGYPDWADWRSTNQFLADGVGGKEQMDGTLEAVNTSIDKINGASHLLQSSIEKMDGGGSAGFLSWGGHSNFYTPPQWLASMIGELNGVLDKVNKVKVHLEDPLGKQNTRPFFHKDSVIFSRPLMGDLGDLDVYNYQKHLTGKLKPITDVLKALQTVIDINNDVMKVLVEVHGAIPYSPYTDALEKIPCSAGDLITIPFGGTGCIEPLAELCESVHDDLLDEILPVQMGIGEVLLLVQKIIIEFAAMGQQGFDASMGMFYDQVGGFLPPDVQGNLENIDMTGLMAISPPIPSGQNLDATQVLQGWTNDTFALPQYGIGDSFGGDDTGGVALNIEKIGTKLFEALLAEIQKYVATEVTKVVTEQIILVGTTLSMNAVPVAGWIAAAAAGAAIKLVVKELNKIIKKNLKQISGSTTLITEFVANDIIGQLPFFKSHPVISTLDLPGLCTGIGVAAVENRDPSEEVTNWLTNLGKKFEENLQQVAMAAGNQAAGAAGIDQLGGVLKGYMLRHRQRNLIEFDAFGTEVFEKFRGSFDQAYHPAIFKKKATWVIHNEMEFEMLVDRYVKGTFGNRTGGAEAGDTWWKPENYALNQGYGLNGIIYYDGSEDLTINFPESGPFLGKCTLFSENSQANIIVEDCKLKDKEQDVLVVITFGNLEITKPGGDPEDRVELSMHLVGANSTFKNDNKANMYGNIVLKRYTVQQNKSEAESLQGDMKFNEHLEAGSTDDPRPNHLFVTISPQRLGQAFSLSPP